jgi:hypothetical protein
MEERMRVDLRMEYLGQLGKGSFGEVVRGRGEDGKELAVKIVNKGELK